MIRVLVIAHQPLARDGLRLLIDSDRTLRVSLAAANADEAMRHRSCERIHVALVDIDAPDIDITALAQTLRKRAPRMRIILLASNWSDELIGEALTADINGYLLKEENFSVLKQAIRRVHAGESCFSRRVRARLIAQTEAESDAPDRPRTRLELLTQRERQLLRLLATGLTLQRACESLGISYKTADRHKVNLMKKLDIHDRVELARYAIREGIIEA